MDDTDLTPLRQAVQAVPDDAEARLALLQALVAAEQWQEADEVSLPLRQHDAPPDAALTLLAIISGKLGRWDEAVQTCHQALELQPDDALLLFNLGTALAHQDDVEAARKAFEKAIEQQEDWAELQYNWGTVLLRQEHYTDALDAFERATELRESYVEAHFSCGNVHAMKGLEANGSLDYYEIDCAINAYKRAIQHRPGYPAALYNLGMLYGRMGSDEGLRVWDQYLEATDELDEEATFRVRAQEYKRDLQDRLR
ncbi:MAG: tetratricopeptide repeat protein [Candidatus Tectomicrobia bacterium]|nr:tetratricopeptide repeat protein [Candidatus Tectomicrobia bacterium]